MRFLITLAVLLLLNLPIFAHRGGMAVPADVWSHWNFEPLLLASLLLSLALYVRGMIAYPIAYWRNLCFVAGIAVLFVSLVSPLEAMSTALFSAHMVQHLLLILVAAPLLTVSRPLAPLLRALPRAMQKSIGSIIQKPALQHFNSSLNVFMLNLAALAFWHLPAFYEAAFSSDVIHALEHASFLLTSFLFWWTVLHTKNYGARILLIFAVMMTSGFLGALMSFASTPWYSHHVDYVGAWGLSLLEDQQLAGMFMWIPPGIVYALTAALVLAAWLSTVERNTLERERRWAKEGADA
jgi:putative membrane protein